MYVLYLYTIFALVIILNIIIVMINTITIFLLLLLVSKPSSSYQAHFHLFLIHFFSPYTSIVFPLYFCPFKTQTLIIFIFPFA